MIALKINKQVQYDSRSLKIGNVQLELSVNPTNSGYDLTITDYVLTEREFTNPETEQTETATVKDLISRKTMFKTAEEINTLYAAVQHLIPEGLSHFEREQELQRQGFLFYVQHDEVTDGVLIYGCQPNDFEIVRDA